MTVNVLDFNDSVPSNTATKIMPIVIQTNTPTTLAKTSVTLLADAPLNNRVEVNASVGVAGVQSVSQVIFRIFRDGILLFDSQPGVQSATEQFSIVRMVAADFNVSIGTHEYSLTVEKSTGGTFASVSGPITLSALALGPVA